MARPVGLREQNRIEALRRIRATAAELLADRNFDEITTREVAERAGMGEATLFRHVESKQALLMLAYGDRMDAVLDAVEDNDRRRAAGRRRATGFAFCDRVLDIFRARADFYLERPNNARLYLLQGFDARNPSLARNLGQGDRIVALATRIIADGQTAGVLSPQVDPGLVAVNCHGTFIHEIERTPVRDLPQAEVRPRVEARLSVQLFPLVLDASVRTRRKENRT